MNMRCFLVSWTVSEILLGEGPQAARVAHLACTQLERDESLALMPARHGIYENLKASAPAPLACFWYFLHKCDAAAERLAGVRVSTQGDSCAVSVLGMLLEPPTIYEVFPS